MYPILYEKNEQNFQSIGIAILSDCLSCTVNEELNGKYECEFSYSISGVNFEKITADRIIKVQANEVSQPQLFRIYKSSKAINGIVKFYCQHISYDLNMLVVEPFGDLLNVSANYALNQILTHTVYGHQFTVNATVGGTKKIVSQTPKSVRKWLGDDEGCIHQLYGGEFEFDNFNIKLSSNRGQDKGVKIQYGKNLKSINAELDIQSVYSSVYPYAITDKGQYKSLTEKTIEFNNANQYGEKRTLILDLSEEFEKGETITESKLRTKANEYVNKNKVYQIQNNIKVDFIQLWQSKDYATTAALEKVKLGDFVTVLYKELGVNALAEVISYSYDSLAEKYKSIELGDAKQKLTTTLNKVTTIESGLVVEKSEREKAIDKATELITGGLGGYVVISPNDETGYPEEILIMDTDSKLTANNVIRLNKNGIGFSTTGYSGRYTTAWTIDGSFVADFITSGTLNADIIKAGTLQDVARNTSFNLTNGEIKLSLNQSNIFLVLNRTGIKIYNSSTNDVIATLDFNGIVTTKAIFGTGLVVGGTSMDISEPIYLGRNGNKWVIKASYVQTDNIQCSSDLNVFFENSKATISLNNNYLYSNKAYQASGFSLAGSDGIEAGSFYKAASGNSVLNTNVLQVDGVRYSEKTITVDGHTYYVLGHS